MRRFQFLTIASIIAFNSASLAATVVPVTGTPQVNSGSGFRQVNGATEVATGDQVMVPPNGRAEIIYADNCRIPVTPGQVVVVNAVAPCVPANAYGADYQVPVYKAPPPPPEDNSYLLGGAAVGVGVGIWVLTKPSPSSP
jgi:hypothetical protein